jgi:hypothetical protein
MMPDPIDIALAQANNYAVPQSGGPIFAPQNAPAPVPVAPNPIAPPTPAAPTQADLLQQISGSPEAGQLTQLQDFMTKLQDPAARLQLATSLSAQPAPTDEEFNLFSKQLISQIDIGGKL